MGLEKLVETAADLALDSRLAHDERPDPHGFLDEAVPELVAVSQEEAELDGSTTTSPSPVPVSSAPNSSSSANRKGSGPSGTSGGS